MTTTATHHTFHFKLLHPLAVSGVWLVPLAPQVQRCYCAGPRPPLPLPPPTAVPPPLLPGPESVTELPSLPRLRCRRSSFPPSGTPRSWPHLAPPRPCQHARPRPSSRGPGLTSSLAPAGSGACRVFLFREGGAGGRRGRGGERWRGRSERRRALPRAGPRWAWGTVLTPLTVTWGPGSPSERKGTNMKPSA